MTWPAVLAQHDRLQQAPRDYMRSGGTVLLVRVDEGQVERFQRRQLRQGGQCEAQAHIDARGEPCPALKVVCELFMRRFDFEAHDVPGSRNGTPIQIALAPASVPISWLQAHPE